MGLIGIKRGGGTATQLPGESRERRGTSERGGERRRSVGTEPLVRLDQLAWRRRVGQAWQRERGERECF
jgi:hypothetical protein